MLPKRASLAMREESYEHVLMCLICRNLFDDSEHQPKFLPCHHTFCKDCLREYVRQSGDEIECPSCRKIATIPVAGVAALQTNFYIKYIQGLVSGGAVVSCTAHKGQCSIHAQERIEFYCPQCNCPVCPKCFDQQKNSSREKGIKPSCLHPTKVPLTTITEDSHQKLDTAFSHAYSTIEVKKKELDATLKGLCNEKDDALVKIEATFEQQTHTLNRRSTLLKNKVIDIYKENVEKLESDLEEMSTAMTCLVSLKEYHEDKISHGEFKHVESGIEEIGEVDTNVKDHIRPVENHIVFEASHGIEKFRATVKDLGRVRCTRPMVQRAEPDGFDDSGLSTTQSGKGALVKSSAAYGSIDSPDSTDTQLYTPEKRPEIPGDVAGGTKGGARVAVSINRRKQYRQPAGQKVKPAGAIELSKSIPPLKLRVDSYSKSQGQEAKGFIAASTSANTHKDTDVEFVEATPDSLHSSSPDSDPGTPTGDEAHNVAAAALPPRHMSHLSQPLPDSILNSLGLGQADANANIDGPVDVYGLAQRLGGAVRPSHLANLQPDPPQVRADRLRADKQYYHTVYTSYDEEELLRELRGGAMGGDDLGDVAEEASSALLDRAIAGGTSIPEMS